MSVTIEADPTISAFNQKLHRLRKDHIRLLPDGDDYVVERIFPAPHHLANGMRPLDRATAVHDISQAQRHFDLLRNDGIVVPEVKFKLIEKTSGQVAIRSLAEYIPSTSFGDYWNWPNYGNRALLQPHAAQLASSLTKYFAEVVTEGAETVLGDITSPVQYGVMTDTEQVVLYDTDPIVRGIDPNTPDGRWSITEAFRSIEAWGQMLQPTHVGDKVFEAIEEAMESLSLV